MKDENSRASPKYIIRKLSEVLDENGKSIKEINEEVGINRKTLSKYLNSLSNFPFVKKYKDGRKTCYKFIREVRLICR